MYKKNKFQENSNLDKKDSDIELQKTKKSLTKKSIMVLVAGLVVVAALFALGVAWYTRVVSSYAVAFDTTDYDLAVSESRDSFAMNTYTYSQVKNSKMAPGTLGWLPMSVSLSYSGTDAGFEVTVTSHIPEKLSKHFRMFYLKEATKVTDLTAPYGYKYEYKAFEGDALPKESDIDSLATDPNLTSTTAKADLGLSNIDDSKINYTTGQFPKYIKVYLDTYAGGTPAKVTDVIKQGDEQILCIYWQWYLDLEAAKADHDSTFKFYVDDTTEKTWAQIEADGQEQQAKDLWDALDNDIGRYNAKYSDAFRVSVNITAAEITPSNGTYVSSN